MSDEKPRVRVQAGSAYRTADSFQNFQARLGYGTQNLSSHSTYGYNPITRNRQQLDWMYRGSWIVGKAVDAPADDMVKAGIKIKGSLPPEDMQEIETELVRTGTWTGIANTARWSRLYGGAIGVLLISGQRLDTELRIETVGRDSYKGIYVLDRWMLTPSLTDLVQEPGPCLGQPRTYLVNEGVPMGGSRIHYSRIIRLDGVELPYWERQAEMGWGLSVLERLYDRLLAFDSTTTGAAQLVYKAHLRIMKLEGLRAAIAAGGKAIEGIVKNLEMIRQFQTNEGMTVIDAKDEFVPHTYTFSGLSDILLQFGQQLSGALGVPMVRLFGQTPTGLNTNGESDLRTYYDEIGQYQRANLTDPMTQILHVVHKSKLGKMPADDFDFEFSPLWQMTEEQKATVSSTIATAISTAFEGGLIDQATAMKELKQSSEYTGIFSNISDDDIADAEAAPPAFGETSGLGDPAQELGDPAQKPGPEGLADPGGDEVGADEADGEPDSPPQSSPPQPLVKGLGVTKLDVNPDANTRIRLVRGQTAEG